MNNIRSGRDGRRSSRGSSGDRGSRRAMFSAVCSNCGNDCKVPFQPRNDKPIYCSDCFEKMGSGNGRDSGRRSRNRDGRGGDSRGPRQDFSGGKELEKLSKSIELMNTKLDKLISIMLPADEPKKADIGSSEEANDNEDKKTKVKKASKKKEK